MPDSGFGYSSPTSASPAFTEMTTISADGPDELDELDELHQAWALGHTESAVEETGLADELPAFAQLSSPAAPEVQSGDQTGGAETPHYAGTSPASRRRLRRSRRNRR